MSLRTRSEQKQAAELLDKWLAYHERELVPARPDANEAGRAVLAAMNIPVPPRSGDHDRL